jgi:hypothetical protein
MFIDSKQIRFAIHISNTSHQYTMKTSLRIASVSLATSMFLGVAAIVSAAPPLVVDVSGVDDGRLPSPLRVVEQPGHRASGPVVSLELDATAYDAIKDQTQLRLRDFALAPLRRGGESERVSLNLRQIRVHNEDTQFVLGRLGGEDVSIDAPNVAMFAGHVAGDAASKVFLSFSPHGTNGFVRYQNTTQLISSGPHGHNHDLMIYNLDTLPAGMIHWRDHICQTQTHAMAHPEVQPIGAGTGAMPCRRVTLAIETDREFLQSLFNDDQAAATAYIVTIIGATSTIYVDALNTDFEITYVRLWDQPDPWTSTNTYDQLFQYRDYWNANMSHVDRHLGHYLSGRELGGGIAWLSAICHPQNGYGLSANLNGFFPLPLEDNSDQNWDIIVVAHEIGHNFGTSHTHNYCPPLDQCPPQPYFGECQDEQVCIPNGTIMGYCHLCENGLANVVLEFHPVVVQTMYAYLNSITVCDVSCPAPTVVHVPADVPTIQEGIDTVSIGGEVIVAPGVYHETIDFQGKPVHVYSSAGSETTIIDAQGSGTVVQFVNDETATSILEGFTITGGVSDIGGGVRIAGASPAIINCQIEGNIATITGGGVHVGVAANAGDMSGTLVCDNLPDNFTGNVHPDATVCDGPLDVLTGDCFTAHAGLGCQSHGCTMQVYALQPSCLTDVWDASCADLAQQVCVSYQHDRGESNLQLFLGGSQTDGGDLVMLNAFEIIAGAEVITAIDILWPSSSQPEGLAATLHVWSDPTQDGSPADAQVLVSVPVVFGDADTFESFPIDPLHIGPVGTSFFVGIHASASEDQYPVGAFDLAASAQSSWVAGAVGSTVDPNNLGDAPVFDIIDNLGFPSNVVIRARSIPASTGDLNGDGVINVSDLLILLGAWGDCPASGPCPADLNGDGTVNVSDLLILLGNWG